MKTIYELEKESGLDFGLVIQEYFDSCISQGYTDMKDCAKYFCTENSLDKNDYFRVLNALEKLNKSCN